MAFAQFRLLRKYFSTILIFKFSEWIQGIQAFHHKLTYHSSPLSRNVVVLGGSFSGIQLARRLTQTLPTGYKVVLVEKNSHFHYCFNFPRYSVITGHEQQAFIPYSGISRGAPSGIFEQVHDTGVEFKDGKLQLLSGNSISFDFLAVATGATQSPPAKLLASETSEACTELRQLQERIRDAKRIAIIGGGAVGVQLASDVKSVYPAKNVALIHSRSELLPNFGKAIHEYVAPQLQKMGVEVMLEERPELPDSATSSKVPTKLRLKNGRVEEFNLIIPCTGQSANSQVLSSIAPECISPTTGRILVKPTLQISHDDYPNIFAFGDVAETGGPKMARAGMIQAEIVKANIISLIKEKYPSKSYTPIPLEGALKLSLGLKDNVIYVNDGDELVVPGKASGIDLNVANTWKHMGAT